MDDRTLALLGDRAAQDRITERGELLPCPMCASEEVSIQGDGYNVYDPVTLGYVESVEDEFVYAVCENCGLTTEAVYLEDEEFEDAVKRVTEKWNHRSPILTETQLALLKIAEKPRKFREGTNHDT